MPLVPSRPINASIVIQGITERGKAFRPSDWAERLCGVMCAFGGDQQLRYSPYVKPVMLDGVRCVAVDPALAQLESRAFRFLLDFARDNKLVVINPDQPLEEGFCLLPDNPLKRMELGRNNYEEA